MTEENACLKLGVLGMSHDHVWDNLKYLSEVSDVEVVAGSDDNPDLRAKFQDVTGLEASPSHRDVLDREDLDGVLVFSDNAMGGELAIEALESGLHVMIEKPMADCLERADAMLAAARSAGRRLMVNWPFAWWPQLRHALHLTRQGTIGDVWQVRYRAAHQGPRELGCSEAFCEWLYNDERNGPGAYMDYCCYGVLLARVLLGMPARVTAVMDRLVKEDITCVDNGLIVMSYARAMAVAEGSWTQVGKLSSYQTTIYGTKGTLLVEPRQDGRLLLATADDPEGSPVDVPELPSHEKNPLAHFAHLIRNEDATPIELCHDRTGRDVSEILDAGILAVEDGSDVSLPLRPHDLL